MATKTSELSAIELMDMLNNSLDEFIIRATREHNKISEREKNLQTHETLSDYDYLLRQKLLILTANLSDFQESVNAEQTWDLMQDLNEE